MLSLNQGLIIAALLGSAIIGGGLFVFSSFIMKSLSRLGPAEGIAAMQSINVVVINLSFIGTFFATAILSVVILLLPIGGSYANLLANTGAVLYLVGTFLVTVRGNVPLNNQLAAVSADDEASVAVWENYLVKWTRLNTLRTACGLLAVVSFAIALTTAA
ncbi:MAG: DUF1772 domain-containing protein [Woeseiaceae bacterium]|nr:DUF1772 domain-containing protein [Woeseiaceae bacterium]